MSSGGIADERRSRSSASTARRPTTTRFDANRRRHVPKNSSERLISALVVSHRPPTVACRNSGGACRSADLEIVLERVVAGRQLTDSARGASWIASSIEPDRSIGRPLLQDNAVPVAPHGSPPVLVPRFMPEIDSGIEYTLDLDRPVG